MPIVHQLFFLTFIYFQLALLEYPFLVKVNFLNNRGIYFETEATLPLFLRQINKCNELAALTLSLFHFITITFSSVITFFRQDLFFYFIYYLSICIYFYLLFIFIFLFTSCYRIYNIIINISNNSLLNTFITKDILKNLKYLYHMKELSKNLKYRYETKIAIRIL